MSASRSLRAAQAGLSLCLAAFAMSSGALAGDPTGILGRDDVYFARRLLEVGYHDLASKVCDALLKSPDSSDAERMGASALMLDVDADKASRDPDPQKRMEVLRANLTARQDFIAKNPDSPVTPTLRANMPLAYRLLAEATIATIKAEKDAAKVAKLEGEAKQMFLDGMKGLIAEVATLDDLRSQTLDEKNAATVEQQYVMAKYNLARLRYFRSLLYKPNDLGREQILGEAIEAFQQFTLDHNDTLVCFEGQVLQALCEIELGKNDDALLTLDEAIKVRESWPQDNKGRYEMPPEGIEIVSNGVVQKMKLLDTLKQPAEAIATAEDFIKTTVPDTNPDAYYAVKLALVDSLNAAGKTDQAEKSAREIMDQDKTGRFAARAREILAKGGGGGAAPALGVTDLLQLADAQASRGEIDEAIETCRKAIYDPGRQGSKPGGAQALLRLGSLYQRKNFLHEAAAAYDQLAVIAAGTDDAPEGLWQAIQVDMQLKALEKKPFYKRRIDERLSRIAREYPKHPAASQAQLIEGRQLETEKRYADAATAYMKVLAGASAYEEAMYRAGYCFLRDGQRLVSEKKDAEAKAMLQKSEEYLKKSIDAIAPARQKTLDSNALANLDRVSFEARVSLANLYLMEVMAKDKDALALLDGAEADAKGDADKLTSVWRLRIQALQKLGKLDDAEKLLATLMAGQPDAPATGAAAGILARAFDKRAGELVAKDAKSKEARALYDKAARYYEASVRPQLASRSFSTTALSEVAERVYALAFVLNDLPDSVTSSANVDLKKIANKAYFESAVRVYKAIYDRAPSYRTEVKLARSLGFLGRFEDAAKQFEHLFENEAIVDPTTHVIKPATLTAKKELLLAYVEWGVAEREIGKSEKQDDRISHAREIFETVCRSVGQDYEAWWHSKYGQIQCLADLGIYDQADIAIRAVERTSQDYDGNKYGLRDKFVALAKFIATKVTK